MGFALVSATENNTAELTASEFEKQKTAKQRAEDVAYTINHSLYCTFTDWFGAPINAATDNWLSWLIPGCGHDHGTDANHQHGPGCGHDHGHDHGAGAKDKPHVHGPGCGHDHGDLVQLGGKKKDKPFAPTCGPVDGHDHHGHDHGHAPTGGGKPSRWDKVKGALKHSFSKERMIQYTQGEFIGDLGAIPITVGVQRIAPGFMDGLRKVAEPVFGPLFKWGIERESQRWAKKHLIDESSQEYKQHVKDVYEHELRHFPQAIVWTGSALALNTGYQMYADKRQFDSVYKKLLLKSTSCLTNVLVTAGVVVAGRAFMPSRMRSFDQFTSEHFIMPATRAIGKPFGVTDEALRKVSEEKEKLDHGSWAERVSQNRKDVVEHHVQHCPEHEKLAGACAVPAR